MSVSTHDPVCGQPVERGHQQDHVTYAGTTYLFCSAACARTFARDPEHFVSSIDGVKPTDRVPLAEAERQHRPPNALRADARPGAGDASQEGL